MRNPILGRWRITLTGAVPSKKNLLRRSRNGGLFRNRDIATQIDALTLQAQSQWGRDPLSNPTITARFYCRDMRSDLDNKWTTVQDCLVKAGVLKNDNLKHLRGPVTFAGCVDSDERVEIDLEVAA